MKSARRVRVSPEGKGKGNEKGRKERKKRKEKKKEREMNQEEQSRAFQTQELTNLGVSNSNRPLQGHQTPLLGTPTNPGNQIHL